MVFQNEQRLIDALKEGKTKAVEQWYEESKTALERFFAARVAQDGDTQELVHDTFLSVLSSLPLFRGDSGLWSFMLSIARHELSDYWRKRYAKRALQALPFGETLLESMISTDTCEESRIKNEELKGILCKLPEEIVELLERKYVDGTSVKELAAQYGLSFAAMQSKLYRAKELFKDHYSQEFLDKENL